MKAISLAIVAAILLPAAGHSADIIPAPKKRVSKPQNPLVNNAHGETRGQAERRRKETDERFKPAATCRIGNRQSRSHPNGNCEFPRETVPPNGTVQVELKYPQSMKGEEVRLTVVDGGKVRTAAHRGLLAIDENGRAEFSFIAGTHPGIYRVMVSRGGRQHVLQFWVDKPANESTTRLEQTR